MDEQIRVALVTSWNTRCGIAEYAINLVSSTVGVRHEIIPEFSQVVSRSQESEIVVLNCELGLFRTFPWHDLKTLRSQGKKILMILHNTTAGNNRSPLTDLCDAVVVHEETTDGFWHIPHGVPEFSRWPSSYKKCLGMAGFPFNWKGFHPAAQAAAMVGLGFKAIMPRSDHVDVEPMVKVVKETVPDAEIITDYLPEHEVIRQLAECMIVAFPYMGGATGISGAVRMGIAAQRPLVVTRDRQFRDLFKYEDEIYFVQDSLAETVKQAYNDFEMGCESIPCKVYEETRWSKVGEMYVDVYRRLLGR